MREFKAFERAARGLALAAVAGGAFALAAPASAEDCAKMGDYRAKRETVLASISQLVASNKGKQLDASVFCARAQPLGAADNAMMAFLVKNKDWCQIPDDVIEQFKSVRLRDQAMAGKACSVAAQMKARTTVLTRSTWPQRILVAFMTTEDQKGVGGGQQVWNWSGRSAGCCGAQIG